MTLIFEKGTRTVAKSYQIQAFRIILFYYSNRSYCSCIGNYANANGTGHLLAFYFWRCVFDIRSLAFHNGGRDVNADHRFQDWFLPCKIK